MNTLLSIASIGVGATVGASSRHDIGIISTQYLGKGLPYGALISNVIGAFIAGIYKYSFELITFSRRCKFGCSCFEICV